jgi:hypothetical protein
MVYTARDRQYLACRSLKHLLGRPTFFWWLLTHNGLELSTGTTAPSGLRRKPF